MRRSEVQARVAPETTVHWQEAIDLAGLHVCRTRADLDRELACKLVRLLPATDLALCLLVEHQTYRRVHLALGAGCPWTQQAMVDPASWAVPAEQRFTVPYRDHQLGTLLVGAPVGPLLAPVLTALLAHYGVALVNLTLNDEARRATDHYCATLQALQEGIVLFQESDPDAVTARLMCLAASMLRATAGALYVLAEVGNSESPLQLAQAMGIPEGLLASFAGADGQPWPQMLLQQPPFHAERSIDPTLGGMRADGLPAILQNIVSLPLRYLGVDAGLCVLFNVEPETGTMKEHIERLTSLGQLGAALLHRLHLEAITAHQRSLQKELQIAAAIQQRLLPTRAPETTAFEFAWRSLSANNIGGDYLDLLVSDRGDLFAIIADASGHGINSALLMSSFRSTYRSEAPGLDPRDLCAGLNTEIANEVGATGMFITAATLRIDHRTRTMCITSAGHNPVLHWRAAAGTVAPIHAHGPPLGFLPDARFGSEDRTVASGDVLLLYTDGVSEATNHDLDMFGDDRVAEILQRTAQQSADHILQEVLAELGRFTGRSRYDDDVSLSVIKVR